MPRSRDFAQARIRRSLLQSWHRVERHEAAGRRAEKLRSHLALKPDHAEAYSNRGHVVQDLQRLRGRAVDYDCAIALKPDYPEAWNNRGAFFARLTALRGGGCELRPGDALKPDFAEAHWNKGLSLLLLGQLAEGLQLYEWRQNAALRMRRAHLRNRFGRARKISRASRCSFTPSKAWATRFNSAAMQDLRKLAARA